MANSSAPAESAGAAKGEGQSRRDFLTLTSTAVAAVGAGAVAWSFIDYMNPSADVLALATIETDLSKIEQGSSITVKWRGKPVFIRHRTPAEIERAKVEDDADLKHPEKDAERVHPGKEQWLILVGICTHLGCVPQGQKPGEPRGEYGGWFCPCHGSHYDTSGRIRKGPAPRNLELPENSLEGITFKSDTLVMIGKV